tara:strand:- start:1927 stop:2520 length:594 start_codon:yes stop_codon:yes gene_type:complete
MAYPSVSGPYGLVPVNLIGGQVFAGATRSFPITTGSATAIYSGDIVKLNSSGTLDKDAGTDAATPVGVFLGCSYTDATYGKTFRQYFPAGTAAADIEAYVCDDPDALFKVAVVSATTTIGYVNQTAVGNNAVLVQNAGSTVTGNSKVAIDNTTATTNTWPVRVVDVIAETTSATGSFTEVIVKWNAGMHQYNNATGV